MKYYLGTIIELQAIEIIIRNNANIPNQIGTLRWGLSLVGEEAFLPIQTTVSGIYAVPVPKNNDNGMAWNGCDEDCLKEGITWVETSEFDFEFETE